MLCLRTYYGRLSGLQFQVLVLIARYKHIADFIFVRVRNSSTVSIEFCKIIFCIPAYDIKVFIRLIPRFNLVKNTYICTL